MNAMSIFVLCFLAAAMGAFIVQLGFNLFSQTGKKPQTQEEKTPEKEDVYAGVFHIFKMNGLQHERPVYVKKYRGNDLYYEYDSKGKQKTLGSNKEDIIKCLNGENVKTFKKYEVE